MNDAELLRLYVRRGSEHAFSELVARHLPLVYSAALRQTNGDAELAREVAQNVFIDLARKARLLTGHPALVGWLHTSTHYAASNLRRAEHRRLARERLSVAMHEQTSSDPAPDWDQISPVLDEAIGELSEEDRTAVLLRYFENQEHKAIGGALGITEDAARMRVSRALDKLRSLLSARSIALSAFSLGTVLAAHSATALPPGLTAAITANTFATIATAGTGGWVSAALQAARSRWIGALIPAAALFVTLVAGVYLGTRPPAPASATGPQPPPRDPPENSFALAATESNAALVPAAVEPKKGGPADGEFQLRLLDARSGAGLPDGKVYVAYFGDAGKSKSARFSSDSDGCAYVEVPRAPYKSANIFVTTDAHVPISITYDASMVPDYPLKIDPGTQIGGLIVDEAGQPVPGVKIEFHGHGIDTAKNVNVEFGPDTKQVSDPAGRWSCNIIPRDLESVSVVLTHSKFAPTTVSAPANTPAATNSVLTIKRGLTVSGVVLSTSGSPIEKASVRQVHNRSAPKLSGVTDSSGRFELRHLAAGELMLAVQADKFAPTLVETNLNAADVELQFTLGPGMVFRGHVVDDQGAPITNALVKTDWDNRGLRKIEWSTRTDTQGRFEWDSAPTEPLLYWFEAAGFDWIRMRRMEADGSDHEVRLLPKDKASKSSNYITGTVLDADTGGPLDGFRVLKGDVNEMFSDIDFRFATEGKEGVFRLPLPGRVYPSFQIQIQKDGYLPVASSTISLSAGSQHLTFQMHRGDGPGGVVLLPGGEPAANATVFLYESRGGVYMDKPGGYRKEPGISAAARVETDATGQFKFEPKLQARGFIAIHEQGFVEVFLPAFNGTLQLQPWGRVEGKLRFGSEARANRRISLGNALYRYGEAGRMFPALSLWLETITDSEGNFAFDKVPPGERRIALRLDNPLGLKDGRIYESHAQTIEVSPGTATQVDLGGGSIAVSGRLIFPAGTNGLDWQGVVVEVSSRDPEHRGPAPKREDFQSSETFVEALKAYAQTDRAFWTSEIGRSIERTRRDFSAFCAADGSFVIPGVTAGDYTFKVDVRQKPAAGVGPSQLPGIANTTSLASLSLDLTIPEANDAQSLDLGVLELKPAAKATAGR